MPVPPVAPRQAVPEYNEQFIEGLAQRLMPRLMPEILYHVRNEDPTRVRSRLFGMSLALAIVSIVMMVPLTAIMLGIADTLGGGIAAALIGVGVIGVVMVLINALFNYMLFHAKS
ncbi:MAG TPA: hypothetical protein VNG51_12770 [Ktedonobacteraceae bacterium]|nr:hypothetical protein [Ktedonobacteraceae bacterium]